MRRREFLGARHYEMIADRSTGLALGQELPLGTRGHKFTVVGLMKNETTSSGDPWDTSPCTTRRRSSSNSLLQLSGARSRAQDRTIIGLIVQQALSMGLFGYFAGLALVLTFQPYFPRRLVLDPESVATVFVITVVMCLAASTLGIRLALKVDPAAALAAAG